MQPIFWRAPRRGCRSVAALAVVFGVLGIPTLFVLNLMEEFVLQAPGNGSPSLEPGVPPEGPPSPTGPDAFHDRNTITANVNPETVDRHTNRPCLTLALRRASLVH